MRISDWSSDVCSSDLDADLLDAYVYGTFDFGDRELAVKLGRQVLNWGESSFVLNGINSILAFDSNQLHVPGDELDAIVIPARMLWLLMGWGKDVEKEAFTQ